MDNESVAVVIASYNRKYLLTQCIESLLKQTYEVSKVFIIDNNSTDGTTAFLKEKYFLNPKINIVRLRKNMGSGGAFYVGIKKALESGFDWIWLMDDDALPLPDALEKLSKYFYLKKENVLGFASSVIYKGVPMSNRGFLDLDNFWPIPFKPIEPEFYKNNSVIEIDFAASIGLLLTRKIIECAGLPNKKMFIYGDDVEWAVRLKKCGRIFLIPESIVQHNDINSEPKFRKILWKKYKIIPIENFYRYYFAYRNLIYIGRLYGTNRFKFFSGLLIQLIKLFIGILLFDDNKIKRILTLIRAVHDGFKINLQEFQKFSKIV